MTESARLMIIDGHSLAYRGFFSIPPESFITSAGQYTNAVYSFMSMLRKLIETHHPTHLCVAFDLPGGTFRSEKYAEYKAGRAKTPEEFKGQIDQIKEVLDAANIKYLTCPGFEADDILATVAKLGAEAGMQVYLSSGDRDAIQLVSEQVTLLYPKKSMSDMTAYTPEMVEQQYQVSPSQYRELAALVGEKADNLPGVDKVGPKTAVKWLSQYGNLDNLLAHADEIGGVVGANLRAQIGNVQRNQQLNRLVDDLELGVGLDDLTLVSPDVTRLNEIFDKLEFNTLRDRLFKVLPKAETGEESAKVEINLAEVKPASFANWLADLKETVGVDLVTRASHLGKELIGLGLATQSESIFIDPANLTPADEAALANWLGSNQAPKVVHDAKTCAKLFWERGWQISGVTFDTQLASYLLNPGERNYDIEKIANRYLGVELAIEEAAEQETLMLDFEVGIAEAQRQQSTLRAGALVLLAETLAKELNEANQKILTELEIPVALMLAKMESDGIAVDVEKLNQLHKLFESQAAKAAQDAYQALGHEIKLNSTKQLQVALFEELELPHTRKIPSGYTTNAEAINWLYSQTQHPFLEALLRYREQTKLLQVVDGLLKSIGQDGRIHTTFMMTSVATGRLSSVDPNLQNIPFRTADGRQIRDCFVPGDKFVELMSADYSQIEMRVMAHASGDELLIESFNQGKDFHSEMAAKVFQVPAEQVSIAQRSKIKAMNYGLAYGLSAYGLSKQLNIEVGEAKQLMDGYFESFGSVQHYLKSLVDKAKKSGYTETILGRRRYLPGLTSGNYRMRDEAERAALNAPIQGSAADIMKLAMLKVANALDQAKLKSRVLLQIHDEILLEIAEGEKQQVSEIVQQAMSTAIELKVPLAVSVGFGSSWQNAQHD